MTISIQMLNKIWLNRSLCNAVVWIMALRVLLLDFK